MARIKTGPIVADIAGSVGDNVFSRNAYGPYVKKAYEPARPGSTYRTAAETAMTDASSAWAALTDEEFVNWQTFSENYPRKSFHNGYQKINPKALFISSYINQVYAEVSTVPLPIPPENTIFEKMIISIPDATTLNIFFQGTGVTSGFRMILYSEVPKKIQVRSINSVATYKIYAGPYIVGSALNFFTDYQTRFPGEFPDVSERIFFRYRIIHSSSGLEVTNSWASSLGFGAAPIGFSYTLPYNLA